MIATVSEFKLPCRAASGRHQADRGRLKTEHAVDSGIVGVAPNLGVAAAGHRRAEHRGRGRKHAKVARQRV
jgi:hypothetical protein